MNDDMSLPWVRVDSMIGTNPKVLRLLAERNWRALTVFLLSIPYCGGHETGGFIDDVGLKQVGGTPTVASDLVKAGLWEVHLSGWKLHDFEQYQPSKWTAAERAAHGKRAAQARWEQDGDVS